jgi:hypothetical protein
VKTDGLLIELWIICNRCISRFGNWCSSCGKSRFMKPLISWCWMIGAFLETALRCLQISLGELSTNGFCLVLYLSGIHVWCQVCSSLFLHWQPLKTRTYVRITLSICSTIHSSTCKIYTLLESGTGICLLWLEGGMTSFKYLRTLHFSPMILRFFVVSFNWIKAYDPWT